MPTQTQHPELAAFIEGQLSRLARQLAEPADSIFVVDSMPASLGAGLEQRFVVARLHPESPQSLLCMDVDFGKYHRRMELVTGSREQLLAFATESPPIDALCQAILELLAIERIDKSR